MPIIFGTNLISVSVISGNLHCAGEAFGENLYPISNIEYRIHGVIPWTAVASIPFWSDTAAIGTPVAALPAGNYDVRITSSDGEQSTLLNAFTVAGAAVLPLDIKCWVGIGVGV